MAGGGQKRPTIAVLRITDATGRILYEAPQPVGVQVVKPAAAYVLTRLMEGVFEEGGTGNRVAKTMKTPCSWEKRHDAYRCLDGRVYTRARYSGLGRLR